jgi:hypothetical protein
MNPAAMVVQSRAAQLITECVPDAILPSRGIVIQFAVISCGLTTATCERSSTTRMMPKSSGSFVVIVQHKPVAPGVSELHFVCSTTYGGHGLIEANVEVSATPTLYV